jgi:hypothetical protein
MANGAPNPDLPLGDALTLGAWEPATDATGCTQEMRLYFDDQPARGADGAFREPVPVTDGRWLITDWYAPYSGNHHFQIAQYQTCDGGSPTLVGMACLEAVLR